MQRSASRPFLAVLAALLLGVRSSLEAASILVTPTADAATLAGSILGWGVTLVGSPVFVGGNGSESTASLYSAGTFTTVADGGLPTGLPFASGLVLTTGDATGAAGPNDNHSRSANLGLPGDPVLSGLIGASTFDASSLSFSFRFGDGSSGGDIAFRFVFASEEYHEYVGQFNDLFSFEIDGVNRALVPSTTLPVGVNSINATSNSSYFVDNAQPGASYNLQYDGLTTLLVASATGLGPGVHQATIRIADAGDAVLDAAVFIETPSFMLSETPEPSRFVLVMAGLTALLSSRRRARPVGSRRDG